MPPKVPFTPIAPLNDSMAITQLQGNIRDLTQRLERLEKVVEKLLPPKK